MIALPATFVCEGHECGAQVVQAMPVVVTTRPTPKGMEVSAGLGPTMPPGWKFDLQHQLISGPGKPPARLVLLCGACIERKANAG
jgi:hypothetical protein